MATARFAAAPPPPAATGALAAIQMSDYRVTVTEHRTRGLVDSDGTAYISPQVERILGFTPKEWCSSPTFWNEHIHSDDRAQVIEASTRAAMCIRSHRCFTRCWRASRR